MTDKINQTQKLTLPVDTTPKVTVIGGIFFYSINLNEAEEWHTKYLGIGINN